MPEKKLTKAEREKLTLEEARRKAQAEFDALPKLFPDLEPKIIIEDEE
ncbi:hypothetical protein [Streptococcus pneumoniae]|nr:hypothetical protein [Streptococcus pneumoniae]MTW38301.1 hypothetical protein [Streptococcus pneumoniae]